MPLDPMVSDYLVALLNSCLIETEKRIGQQPIFPHPDDEVTPPNSALLLTLFYSDGHRSARPFG